MRKFKNNKIFHAVYTYILLSLFLLGGFLIRWWLLDKRWISPDEGWHLMDAKFILDGKVPFVDFNSRQPVYVYVLSLFLKAFGTHFLSGRWMMLLVTTGIAVFVFLISKKLFNETVALLATTIYVFLPTSVIYSILVREEPLAIFFTCVGMYLLVMFIKNEKRKSLYILLSGVFLSLAYYSRATNLAGLFVVLLFFLIIYWKDYKNFLVNFGLFLLGYFAIVAIFFLIYSKFLSIQQILSSPINPFSIVFNRLQKLSVLFMAETPASSNAGFRFIEQSWEKSISNLMRAINFNLFLLIGLFYSIVMYIYSIIKEDRERGSQSFSFFPLLYSWLVVFAFFYGFHFFQRGFFTQYIREFFPPLIVLTAFVVIFLLSRSYEQKNVNRILVFGLLALVMIFFAQANLVKTFPTKGLYFAIIITLLLYFMFLKESIAKGRFVLFTLFIVVLLLLTMFFELGYLNPYLKKKILFLLEVIVLFVGSLGILRLQFPQDLRRYINVGALSLLAASFVYSIAEAGYYIDSRFDSGWSPTLVKEVSQFIKANSAPSDKIMSGVLIWSLESNRNPFPAVSHTAEFQIGIPKKILREMEYGFANNPPKFIIKDGYIRNNYGHYFNWIQEILNRKYSLMRTFCSGAKRPLEIYAIHEKASYPDEGDR